MRRVVVALALTLTLSSCAPLPLDVQADAERSVEEGRPTSEGHAWRIYVHRDRLKLSGDAARDVLIADLDTALANAEHIRHIYTQMGMDPEQRLAKLRALRSYLSDPQAPPRDAVAAASSLVSASSSTNADPPYPWQALSSTSAGGMWFRGSSVYQLASYEECQAGGYVFSFLPS